MTERSFLRLSGDDRVSFLQGLVTQDVTKLAEARIQFAALLSPQGKLLHDMFLIDGGDHLIIDTDATHAPTLLKRLTMYKLRAKVAIEPIATPSISGPLPDPRHPALPAYSVIPAKAGIHAKPHRDAPVETSSTIPDMDPGLRRDDMRVRLGIPEFGTDIQPDSITAMDAGYDLLHAISFTKGCYVGQEVTARMHYKNIARKGFFLVDAAAPIRVGAPVVVDGKTIGTVTSAVEKTGLAFLKFEDAQLAGLHVDDGAVTVTAPGWMQPKLALFQNAGALQ